jgi:hypothetical protein
MDGAEVLQTLRAQLCSHVKDEKEKREYERRRGEKGKRRRGRSKRNKSRGGSGTMMYEKWENLQERKEKKMEE